jgi:ABC-type sulfate transport system permease subunit
MAANHKLILDITIPAKNELCIIKLTKLGFIIILHSNNCTFPVLKYYLGTLAEAFFLGGMGLCACSLFDQIAIAYMLPLMYYILCFGAGKKLLKDFYLFSMLYGSYQEKVRLAVMGLVLITIGICYPYLVKRIFPKLTGRSRHS